jgi:hypothetical protein
MAREKEFSARLDTSTPLLDDVNVVHVVFNLKEQRLHLWVLVRKPKILLIWNMIE